ncbi:peptide chain release factor N(5)-glutamine methyltransferase [Anianabacter salinae]|uniref:peptide chain release factor N(5)-glutamine methyltransferase n=1 Tax=Anianabacter salinae TaxID=2851023 RepID=UPI00225E0B96|nr:peptide chain release factor N(5)-glutamine methyltransferase [Anianabacter salinae]MBV0912989.1 peptide chain release factor N(5)-glutamine methyltransferase [Anianabacter salinae]
MTDAAAAIAAARARLAAAGVPDPATDARRLLAHVTGRAVPDSLTPDEAAAYAAAITRRAAREPVSHITGTRQFWRHSFHVTPDVLDPRPDTETLVAAALDLEWRSVLDLGTGSGAILLSLLAERGGATGTGTDVSAAALSVARGNAEALGLRGRAAFLKSDWWNGVTGPFDLIVSNPPYISGAEMQTLAPELAFEPRLALTPGGDGLAAYRIIAARARGHLTPQGWLLVEIGHGQGQAVCGLFTSAGLEMVEVRPDLNGKDRVVLGRAPAQRHQNP